VRGLYTRLTKDGVDAWLDKEKLLPGQDWELEIRKAVREADVVVVCLSKQFNQAGFRQKEVRLALDTAMEQPEGEIFIIPARLEECDTLESLRKWHWVDLFEDDGYENLMRALRTRANTIGVMLQIKEKSKEIQNMLSPLPTEISAVDSALGGLIISVVLIVVGIVLATKLQTVLQILYDLLHWQYFWILATFWVVIDLVWMARWKSLVERIGKLTSKPWIYKTDDKPNEPFLYPRVILEMLATSSQRENRFRLWISAQHDRVFDSRYPLISLGYLVSLVLFAFFLMAEAIVVGNILWLSGVIHRSPDIVYRLDFAILGGALLAAVVGIWTLVELSSAGELMDFGSMTATQRRLYKLFAATTTTISTFVMLVLSVQRLLNLGLLGSNPIMDIVLSFILFGLLAVNNLLSAVLVFQPAILGFLVMVFLLFGVIPVFAFLADIIWRSVYIFIDMTLWILFTPIFAIPYGIGKILSLISNRATNLKN
jgi:hypothetical protein